MACKLTTNRAFILKVKNFCKYYPLTSKDPEYMIRESINSLKRLVDCSKDISLLESLSKEAIAICTHSTPDELFQFQVVGESNRFIIYRPYMFFDKNKNILELYDLIFIPETRK